MNNGQHENPGRGEAHTGRRPLRLLFVKLSPPGDALMLTPTLAAARQAYPHANIWAVVRREAEGILQGCTAWDRILTVTGRESGASLLERWRGDIRILRRLFRQGFSHAFELGGDPRGRWLCALSTARVRCLNVSGLQPPVEKLWERLFNRVSHSNWHHYHRVERDYFTVNAVLALGAHPDAMRFMPERTRPWAGLPGLGTFAVLHTGSTQPAKCWTLEGWKALGRHLLTLLDNVVISAGPDPGQVREAGQLQRALGPRVLVSEGKADWPQLASLLHQAHLFVGLENAPLHLAAACCCPSVALFGPSLESASHPWKVPHRIVALPLSVPQDHPDYPSYVSSRRADAIPLAEVIEACNDMLGGGRELL